ncbi:glucuronate isomerase [Echinicola jeungdonensis]|uniref:Uronate isomerase n=1 Tax=Echinicola jeungdonensis TaxID=709343 RepID=A0ABV5J3X8_9BACT|nr:glucuronate isomerase [Echinicola jeungdonensis]MDN3670649.1 glucuronate isomerase [Echinicola jeungdonensis]
MTNTTTNPTASFITDDFLLHSGMAQRLYHDYARHLPIIDYHCHLSPKDLAENRQFENISQVWLAGDHYKWRAMRTLGIDEKFITGGASDQEKFEKWAYTVPYTLRNPLYHWTHLELKRYFDIHDLLSSDNAKEIYQETTRQLQQESHSTQGLLKRMNVETVCTTDDPIDDLAYHQKAHKDGMEIKLFPTFRPDKAYAVEDPKAYSEYLNKLEQASGVSINSHETLIAALENRIAYFHENGGRLADHGLEQLYYFSIGTYEIESLFSKLLKGQELDQKETQYFKFITLMELSRLYHAKGWTQQFHLGALRNTNERMLSILGPDTGFDSIGDFSQAKALAQFLNELDKTDQLSKTILYNLNPRDNEVLATMIGNFNDGSIRGKIQFGSGWWFLDQKDGMEKQMNALSNMGLLSCFVGMLTDSRSFLSFPRHEYFRRTLCNLIGQDVVNGELPADEKWLGKIVKDICYYNAKQHFNFEQ